MTTKNENLKLKKELLKQQRKISELVKLKIAPNTINILINNNWKQSEKYKSLIASHKEIVKNGNNASEFKQWQIDHDQAYREFASILGVNYGHANVPKNTVVPHKSVLVKNNNVDKLQIKANKLNNKINTIQQQDNLLKIDGKKIKQDINLLKNTNTIVLNPNKQDFDKPVENQQQDADQIKIPKSINFIKSTQKTNKPIINKIKSVKTQEESKTKVTDITMKPDLVKKTKSDEDFDFVVDVSKRRNFVEQVLNDNKIKASEKIKKIKAKSNDELKSDTSTIVKTIKKSVKITNTYYQEDYEMIYDKNKRPSLNNNKLNNNVQVTPFNIINESKVNVNKFTDEFKKLDEKKKKQYEKWVVHKNRKIAKKLARQAKKNKLNFSQSNLIFTNKKPITKIENIPSKAKSFEIRFNQERKERLAAIQSLRKKYAGEVEVNDNESYGTRFFRAISDAIKEENSIGIVNEKTSNKK